MATKGEPTHWASATATSGAMSFSVCGVFRERAVALERMLDHEAVCDGCGVVSGMGVVGGGVGDFHLRLVKAFEAECAWTARVHQLNDGALVGEAAEAVRVHLGGCARCQVTMQGLGQAYLLREQEASGAPQASSTDLRAALKGVLPYAQHRAEDLTRDARALGEFAKTTSPRSSARETVMAAKAEAEKATAAVERAKKLLGVADGG